MRLPDKPHMKALGFVVGIVLPVLALLFNPFFDLGGSNPSQGTAESFVAIASPPDTSGTRTAVADPEKVDGAVQCFGSEHAATDCRLPHVYEAVATAGETCDLVAALRHLEGNPRVDVPFVSVQRLEHDGSLCVLAQGAAMETTGSARGLLAPEQKADAWRRCRDDRSGKDVSCNLRHTAEYVGTDPAGGEDCSTAVERYINASIERLGDTLAVESAVLSDGMTVESICLVKVRGADMLEGSLRGLGARTVPIAD